MINIYSSYSLDKIFDHNNKLLAIAKGGPALFIQNVFKNQRMSYRLFLQKKFVINIKTKNSTERGLIANHPKTSKIVKRNRADDIIIISCIADEWIPYDLIKKSKIFLDVQGYARTYDKKSDFYKKIFWKNIFCLKGTEEEIKKLPKDLIEKQKNKILIITKGKKGSDVYRQGKKITIKPKIIKTINTIGAGDTFFANFIIKFIESRSVRKSASYATSETQKYLLNKQHDQTYKNLQKK